MDIKRSQAYFGDFTPPGGLYATPGQAGDRSGRTETTTAGGGLGLSGQGFGDQSMSLEAQRNDDIDGDGEYDYDVAAYSTSGPASILVRGRSKPQGERVVPMSHGSTAQSASSMSSGTGYVPTTPAVGTMFGYDGADNAATEYGDSELADGTTDGSPAGPSRKKQKRNKPTLSCSECVERKTKCDRGRPHCLSCIKRQTECKYAHVANLLEETNRSAAAGGGRRVTRPLLSKKNPGGSALLLIPNIADRGILGAQSESLGSVALSTGLLTHVPYRGSTASNVFGIGSEHPFANYWTCEGGLPEVISVLPEKTQCEVLLTRYFECFDPVYPMIDRAYFYLDLEHFWAMGLAERTRIDPAFIGVLFAMLALGTQFVTATTAGERKQTSEFYASASNQALRLSCYLSSASIRSIQAMVLVTYFLINDNHASDGWAFAGILMRQACAMGLHRDPNIVTPTATAYEKQQRRKLWQAVLLQDTFLTILLSLPPTATHTDVSVEDLEEEASADPHFDTSVTDTAYIRGSWTLANLVQEVISSPRSLDLPICTTTRHKSKLVADFRAIYRSFPDVFRSWDPESLTQLARTNKRVVRQTLFLSSNYFHNLMLVHASESADVPVNVRGTLDAAHDAITSFFVLFKLFQDECSVWWVFNHRAFLEALCIGGVLKEVLYKHSSGPVAVAKDPLYVRARTDIEKMIEITRLIGEGEQGAEIAQTRVKVLSEFV